jgi:hypothetical protein
LAGSHIVVAIFHPIENCCNLATGKSILVYNTSNHNLTNTPGMAIGPNGTIYVVGMTDVGNSLNKATLLKASLTQVRDNATGQF